MTPDNLRLSDGERLLWSGTPRGGVVLRATDALLVPFTLLWAGFAFFWEAMAWKSNGPPVLKLFGIPFVLVGLYITVGRFFFDAWQRGRTGYGVTNERVLIAVGSDAPSVTSLPLANLTDITLKPRSDGSGSIVFGPATWGRPASVGFAWPRRRAQAPCFDMIPDAQTVYDIILKAQRDRA
jgi:hypothetical protein